MTWLENATTRNVHDRLATWERVKPGATFTIAKPAKPSAESAFSVEELEAMGMVGIYQEDNT